MTSTDANTVLWQHDAQMDYYGKRLATCSSDHHVRIFNVREDGSYDHLETLTGYTL